MRHFFFTFSLFLVFQGATAQIVAWHSYKLIDITNNTQTTVTDGMTWDLANGNVLNVKAEGQAGDNIRFTLSNGHIRNTEFSDPYAYPSAGWTPEVSSVSFTVQHWVDGGHDDGTDNFTINFTDSTPAPGGSYWIQSGSDIHYNDGNVGVGTTAPQSKIHIQQNSAEGLRFSRDSHDSYELLLAGTKGLFIKNRTNGTDEMAFDGNGNIGIGTISPDAKLAVKGDIHTQEVRVDLIGAVAPDYVFKEDYELRTLMEVETFIKENGHLPNIPSAYEMEQNGLMLKEMNLKLLEKVEELTLYILNQDKIQRQLENRVRELEKRDRIFMYFCPPKMPTWWNW